jgi:hypothetical protein
MGEVVQVSTGAYRVTCSVDPSAWGPTTISGAAQAEATLHAEGIDATVGDGGTVTGTLKVIGVTPLRLEADLAAQDAEGAELRLRGAMNFQLADVACP